MRFCMILFNKILSKKHVIIDKHVKQVTTNYYGVYDMEFEVTKKVKE